jgi:hypothetical protein
MLLSLVNKMLEHCRAAGDEMLGDMMTLDT